MSPLKSGDLLQAARQPEHNIFYPYFSRRLRQLLAEQHPDMVGFSLNYLSQALATFAMIGLVKLLDPALPMAVGGGLVTSWMSNPAWRNPFAGFIDHLLPGPGEKPLLNLAGGQGKAEQHRADFQGCRWRITWLRALSCLMPHPQAATGINVLLPGTSGKESLYGPAAERVLADIEISKSRPARR